MNESAPIEQSSSTRSKISARNSSFFVILMISLVVAMISYGIQQYSLQKDVAEGEQKRLTEAAAQHDENHGSEQQSKYLAEQQQLAMVLGDSLKRNPQDTSIMLALSSARIATGDTLGALSVLEKYVKVNPKNYSAQTDYAYILFICGRTQEGQERMLDVLKKDPRNQIALFNMAAMNYKQNKFAEALSWMKRCAAVDTSSEVGVLAKSALVELESEISKQNTGASAK